MALALEQIIQDGRADRVSAIRNLYIVNQRDASTDLESAHMVMRHLTNITMLEIYTRCKYFRESLENFSVDISKITQLTKLIIKDFSDNTYGNVLPIIQATGDHLTLLDFSCLNNSLLDVIDQCRELRVLRLTVIYGDVSEYDRYHPDWGDLTYGSDVHEQFTPFHHLQELHLSNLSNYHFKPALFKSIIASPLLQDLKLRRIPYFTYPIVEAVFNHFNQDGEQLAFTSLRKLEVDRCDFVTNNLMRMVTHERVPLEVLLVTGNLVLLSSRIETEILERFQVEINNVNDDDHYEKFNHLVKYQDPKFFFN